MSDLPPNESADALLRRLEWTVLRPLDGLLQGDHRTHWRGHGLDLVDLRVYQPGDDLRRIDWHLTARLQEPHVRQYTEEREVTAWLLVDLSASMSASGDAAAAPKPLAIALAALLARLLTRQGGRVGALLYRPQRRGRAPDAPGEGAVELLPPGTGRHHVLRLIERLRQPADERTRHDTALADLLAFAQAMIRRRSQVFVLSDFLTQPGWDRPLRRLTQRHDLLAVHLREDVEALIDTLAQHDGLQLEDPETGEHFTLHGHGPAFAQRLRTLVQAQDDAVAETLLQAGADTLALTAGDDLLDALLRCAALRRRRPAATAALRWRKTAPPGRIGATR
jgi:uncharacterized protein (DUF58 family)